MRQIIFMVATSLLLSACQGTMPVQVQSARPANVAVSANHNNPATRSAYQARGLFQYREMASYEDIDIQAVANQFLWSFEPKDVNPSVELYPQNATYPMRRYEIVFSGANAAKVNEALRLWQKRFEQYGSAQ